MEYFGIYGAGSFSRCIYEMMKKKVNREKLDMQNVFFIDDNNNKEGEFLGHQLISFDKFCMFEGKKSAIVAIADPKIRSKFKFESFTFATKISANSSSAPCSIKAAALKK